VSARRTASKNAASFDIVLSRSLFSGRYRQYRQKANRNRRGMAGGLLGHIFIECQQNRFVGLCQFLRQGNVTTPLRKRRGFSNYA